MLEIILHALRLDENNDEFVEFLISKGFDINYKLAGKDCLILKCIDNFLGVSIIEKLTALGADIYSETSKGDNALLIAAEKNEELAVYLVENFDLSKFDKANRFGITPLMHAAMKNFIQLTASLIQHGSDVNATGCEPSGGCSYWIKMNGVSPLALAIRHGNVEIVKMLLEAGADETICDAAGNPPIFSLIRYPFRFFQQSRYHDPIFDKKCEIITLLHHLELTDSKGYTVLIKSLCNEESAFETVRAYDNLPITLSLIEKGANIEAAGNDGRRPLHQAICVVGDVEKKLVKLGADINAQDNEGNTPLLIACKYCSEKSVRWLLKAGADFKIQNNKGETAVDISIEKGYSDALELMI